MATLKQAVVVDDDEDFREFVVSSLEELGYECVSAQDASALMSGPPPAVDLIVLDLMMPGVDGVELLRSLANGKSEARVILMSGIARRVLETAEKTARALGLHVAGSLQKPFRLAQLRQVLETDKTPERPAIQKTVDLGISDQEIQIAIERREFELYFQPQIRLVDHKVVGFEGLVRWKHPVRGILPPLHFIERLESLGLIKELSWIVVELGLKGLKELSGDGDNELGVSLNMSVHSLQELELPDQLAGMAQALGVSPERIVIEITESGLVSNVHGSLDVLTRLRMKGICLSIDDFGTGYSMMEQLQNVPATELKIDRSFVDRLATDLSSRVMIEKIIELGHDLEMLVVAEGVETREQLEFLKARGCDVGQGYLFSRPVPVSELKQWMPKERVWGFGGNG